ncbi:DUF4142 domain-containing protein [Mesorhizobium amorphae]|uniref:DUF4142 domain-containing protein n=1 Tax=Mesorhizobium amorphae TaxID=71433 RepID=UPI000B73CD69|nr:DUF4142 domain-containing protein [Mesorhizobium amorphae]OWK21061.1 membrane protein [Mesorhizobium amorphae CCBAU 01583]
MRTSPGLSSLTAVAAMIVFPAFAADSAQDFVTKAAIGGIFEVDTSKLAQDKVTDQRVKDFAQKMIVDHDAANSKLQSIATEQKLTVPSELDAKHKGDLDKLKASQSPLDQPYVTIQQEAHSDAVTLFESYAADGDNAALKTFAQETLPTLKMHKEMIDKIDASAGASAASEATTPAVKTTNTQPPASPVPGANSFTEDQAKSRIETAGYSNVSKLAKDDQGIWRGQATDKDGNSTNVALDYQGNVFAGTN